MADERDFDNDVTDNIGDTNKSGGSHILENPEDFNTDDIIGDFEATEDIDHEFGSDREDITLEENELDADGEYPSWDDQFNNEFSDDSIYGDPDNVAFTSEDDVFTNDEGFPSYAPGDPMYFGDMVPSSDDDDDTGFSPLFWTLIALGTLLALSLATWGALWANTGEVNPIKAMQGSETSEETTSTGPTHAPVEQTIGEEDPATAGDANRIQELESSLTSAMDDAKAAQNENDKLKASNNNGSAYTSTRTVTKSGPTKTRTTTRTNVSTSRTTVTSRVTNTSTVRPRPSTVTVPSTVRVPGSTVTKEVPTGRVTVTSTVVERWG